jgi:hypothetical protein
MKKRSKKRITLSAVAEASGKKINGQEFLDTARKRPQDFTRNRKMPFGKLVLFMLNMVKSSIQTCLDRFFEQTGQEDTHMAQQSFSEAREKIKWEAFRELFRMIVDLIYAAYYETWHGYRVSAIDGSKMQMPDDPELRACFGTIGKGNTAATGQGSALYDVYNNVLIDAQLEPITTDERELALRHIDVLCSLPSFGKECIIFDRGYASFDLIRSLSDRSISFVMRVRRKFSLTIDRLEAGDHHGVILQKSGYEDIPVRVIKFTLPSGEEETLITDITDKRMGISAFKALYFKRWPIETKFDEVKNKLEVENFSGRTVNAIMQDFFITMYISNVIAVACWEAQIDVDEARELKDNKYAYHVNRSHAIGSFKDRFILAILEHNPRLRIKKIRQILYLMSANPAPSRPDRSLLRNLSPRKAKFRHNRKSNC